MRKDKLIQQMLMLLVLGFGLALNSAMADMHKTVATKSNKTVKAEDQMSGSKADVEMTRKVRERLMDDRSLSMYAKNIQIVTLNKEITLTGHVESQAEGLKIINVAKQVAGAKEISNHLTYTK